MLSTIEGSAREDETARLNSLSNSERTTDGDRAPSYGSTPPTPETPAGNSVRPDEDNNNGDTPGVDQGPYDDALEDVVTSLTRRVRCLFSIVTYPIVPLGTIASLALGWLIYASFVLDVNKSCSHPLHWYAILSLVLVLYAPYHARIRQYLFSYTRERNTERPPNVRRYDQLFHTLALVYVYAGITLVQTCRDDLSVLSPESGGDGDGSGQLDLSGATEAPPNTCAATCPNLFSALRVYVAAIEVFTFSLILPLLFLPCLYLYFIRRTMQDAESLAVLQDRFQEEEALMRNGGVTTAEIMDEFERVELMVDPRSSDGQIVVAPHDGGLEAAVECTSKECCICMEAFSVKEDEEVGEGCQSSDHHVMRAKTCQHLFHRRCIASWVGGRWQANPPNENDESANSESPARNGGSSTNSDNNNNQRESSRRARRTTCPLCRRDVRPNR